MLKEDELEEVMDWFQIQSNLQIQNVISSFCIDN